MGLRVARVHTAHVLFVFTMKYHAIQPRWLFRYSNDIITIGHFSKSLCGSLDRPNFEYVFFVFKLIDLRISSVGNESTPFIQSKHNIYRALLILL